MGINDKEELNGWEESVRRQDYESEAITISLALMDRGLYYPYILVEIFRWECGFLFVMVGNSI